MLLRCDADVTRVLEQDADVVLERGSDVVGFAGAHPMISSVQRHGDGTVHVQLAEIHALGLVLAPWSVLTRNRHRNRLELVSVEGADVEVAVDVESLGTGRCQVQVRARLGLDVPVPRLLRRAAQPFAQHLVNQFVDQSLGVLAGAGQHQPR